MIDSPFMGGHCPGRSVVIIRIRPYARETICSLLLLFSPAGVGILWNSEGESRPYVAGSDGRSNISAF